MKRLYYVDPDLFGEPIDQDMEIREESEGLLTKEQKKLENRAASMGKLAAVFEKKKKEALKEESKPPVIWMMKILSDLEYDIEELQVEMNKKEEWISFNLWSLLPGKTHIEDSIEVLEGEMAWTKGELHKKEELYAQDIIEDRIGAANSGYWKMKSQQATSNESKFGGELDMALLEEDIVLKSWEKAVGHQRTCDMTNEELVMTISIENGSAWALEREHQIRVTKDLHRAKRELISLKNQMKEGGSWVIWRKAALLEQSVKTLNHYLNKLEKEEEDRQAVEQVNRAKAQNNIIMDTDNSVFMVDCSTCAGHKTIINTETWEDETCPHCKGTGLVDSRS